MTKILPEKWTPNRDEVLKSLGAVSETEYKKLQEQLSIATKALKRILYERDERAVGDYLWIANNALKEMEGLE